MSVLIVVEVEQMVDVGSVPEKTVERKVIVYKTLVDPTVAKMTGKKMKTDLFVRFGFLKPKPQEVEYVSMDKYYEPYVVVNGKYHIDYYRRRAYPVKVDKDVEEVIILEKTFKPVPPEKPTKKPHKLIRLIAQERLSYQDKAYLILDKEGRQIQTEDVPQAPSEENPNKILEKFTEKIEQLDIPSDMEVKILKSKIVNRPPDIERVVEELFEISERAIIYTPIYELRFQNTKTGQVKPIRIDGVTAKPVQR